MPRRWSAWPPWRPASLWPGGGLARSARSVRMRPMKLLFLKCGAANREMAARCGDYEDWFRRAMPGVNWDLTETYNGPWKVDVGEYAGVLLSGSPRSLTEPEPWMNEVAEVVQAADRRGTPVLG